MSETGQSFGWRPWRCSWELLAAVATLSVAVALACDVTRDAHVAAERVGQARYQLDALAEASDVVRALSAATGDEGRAAALRARVEAYDWHALFGDRAARLVPSVAGSGWSLVLAPAGRVAPATP